VPNSGSPAQFPSSNFNVNDSNNFIFTLFHTFLLFAILFTACQDPSDNALPNNDTPTEKPGNPTGSTWVEFKNLEEFPVTIYSDPARQVVFAEIPATGTKKVPADPAPAGRAFYPIFRLMYPIETAGTVTIPYNGPGVTAAIVADKTNAVSIPKLESIVINSAYVMLINNSNYSLTFNEGNLEKSPLNGGSTVINSGQNAAYEIKPGFVSTYSVLRNGSAPVAFPSDLQEFKQGIIYVLTFNGTNIVFEEKPVFHLLFPPPSKLIITALSEDSVTLEWDKVNWSINGYSVYRSTSENGAYTKLNTSVLMEPKYIDNELTPFTSYYYKVGANSVNFESLQLNPTPVSTGINVSGNSLAAKFDWLKTNAASNSLYVIEVDSNETLVPQTLSYSGKSGITIVLKGTGAIRTITLSASGNLFTVTGVTLILDNNITLNGRSGNDSSLIYISANGTLIINEGSKITGNTCTSDYATVGGGIRVEGIFVMNGGEISNNKASSSSRYDSFGGGVYVRGTGTFTMNGGKISANSSTLGGGVGVDGVFVMKGGEISGNSSSFYGGGVSVSGWWIEVPDYGSPRVTFNMSGGVIYGNTASADLRNNARESGAALYISDKNRGIMQYGTFSGDNFYRSGDLSTTNTTIRIVNGNLQTN
jgi:hypothetical protein